jgi:hypothetical protein
MLRPFRAHILINLASQGVALGWYPTALSAPENGVLV